MTDAPAPEKPAAKEAPAKEAAKEATPAAAPAPQPAAPAKDEPPAPKAAPATKDADSADAEEKPSPAAAKSADEADPLPSKAKAKKAPKPKKPEVEKVGEDEEGKYVDSKAEHYLKDTDQIKSKVDKDEAAVDGLSAQEWQLKSEKDKENLQELIKRKGQLVDSIRQIETSQDGLERERQNIDDQIQQKMKEADDIRREFEQKAIDRAEEERRLAE